MRHEMDSQRRLETLTRAIGAEAAARDADGAFPAGAFEALRASGLLAAPPVGPTEMPALLRLLAAAGRGDLSVGRIFEGHVNACYLIDRYGTDSQKRRFAEIAAARGLFGVWNTDAPDDPLRLEGARLFGKKNFASGVDGLSHAIVTVTGQDGRQMIIVPVGELPVDRSWWRPVGMKASGSHVADMTGLDISPDWLLGQPDDYIRQPWFSAGAIRFLAVQVGGAHAVFDTAVKHLVASDRAANPYQAHRLARMGAHVETAYLWLDRLGEAWSSAAADPHAAEPQSYLMAAANAGRIVIEASAMSILQEAEQAIGAVGLIAPHPFERIMRDLRTYLRQPNPDGAAAAFAEAIAKGEWTPAAHGAKAPFR
ncbi:acyl-CoA dehydrogenase [Chelativorans sp. ZYF759]|uniref:acyl-CoA dehydrogenase family protein n=1 Tax=Chelativorans sp. ZYF759 TaxID=2692213 RepID=UPI00145D8D44|nr:acyl-CoA dehydrogenase family protein [Chelativorans sp. ZYF759]NMG40773.1 acyl-CoA dehydrogenase [Chelativorans sp. ZYF759]